METMTSLQRVLTTLSHKEPDRVPLFLLFTMHGAKELGLSIREYFSKPENVVEGQLRLLKKYRNDAIYAFHYASVETEAWGGEVLFTEDGPPNAGAPIITCPDDIKKLKPPKVSESPALLRVLKSIELLKEKVGDTVPIIAPAMSPFSLPVIQMGFDHYIELIYEQPELFQQLMAVNEEFHVEWSNAQLAAGATAICYFDPVSSTSIIPKDLYLKTGHAVAKRTIARLNGPTATHFASGRCLPLVDDIAETGTAVIGFSTDEDVPALKDACRGKLTLLGNLNGIEMRNWSADDAERIVKQVIREAGAGGGFILSDNHGEIPYQVPDDVLLAISEAVHKWGNYPLDWIET